jgi:hypothetical protein
LNSDEKYNFVSEINEGFDPKAVRPKVKYNERRLRQIDTLEIRRKRLGTAPCAVLYFRKPGLHQIGAAGTFAKECGDFRLTKESHAHLHDPILGTFYVDGKKNRIYAPKMGSVLVSTMGGTAKSD